MLKYKIPQIVTLTLDWNVNHIRIPFINFYLIILSEGFC